MASEQIMPINPLSGFFRRPMWSSLRDSALDQQQAPARIWAANVSVLSVLLVALVFVLQNLFAGRLPWALVPGFPDVFMVFIFGFLAVWWIYQRLQYNPSVMQLFWIIACSIGVTAGFFKNGIGSLGTGLLILLWARLTITRFWAWMVALLWVTVAFVGLFMFSEQEQALGLRVVLATLILFFVLDQFLAYAQHPAEERARRALAVVSLGLVISAGIFLLLAWLLGARANLWINLFTLSLIALWVFQRQLLKHLWAMQVFTFLGWVLGVAAVWSVGLPSIPFSFVAIAAVALVFRPVHFLLIACITVGLDIYTLFTSHNPVFSPLFQRLGIDLIMLLPILGLSLPVFIAPAESEIYRALQQLHVRRLVGRYALNMFAVIGLALSPLLLSAGESPLRDFITSVAGWYWLYSAILLVLLVALLLALRGQRQRELTAVLNEAEKSSAIQSQFLRSMNHDMRNPLNGFIGTLQNLQREGELPAKAQEYLSIMAGSAQRLKHLLNDITDIGAIERQELSIVSKPFDMSDLLIKSIQLQAQQAENQGVRLYQTVSLPSPCRVQGDALRIGQVLDNLVGNAIKFSPGAEVFVTLGYHEQRLHLQVRDTGIGMDEATLGRVFDRFAQADGSNTRKFQGLGLGLAITHQLVDLMQGDLHCHSTLGEGSEFNVSLPLPQVTPYG